MNWATWQNLGLACLVGVVVAVGPLTPDDFTPSLIAGVATAAAIMAWRAAVARPPDAYADADAGAASRPQLSRKHLGVGLCLLAFAGVFAPTFVWLYGRWTASFWQNAHGIFVPFVTIYLSYMLLRHDRDTREEESSWGLLLLAAGLMLVVLDSGVHSLYLSAFGLILCLAALSLLFLGARRTRLIAVPLFMGILMIPIPTTVATHLYLKTTTAVAVEPLVSLVGIPVFREQTVILLPNSAFVVTDACSGFSTLYAALAVAMILAWYSSSNWRRLSLLTTAILLAFVSNIARTLVLILLTHRFGDVIIETAIHEASGVAAYTGILVVLFLMADRPRLRMAFG